MYLAQIQSVKWLLNSNAVILHVVLKDTVFLLKGSDAILQQLVKQEVTCFLCCQLRILSRSRCRFTARGNWGHPPPTTTTTTSLYSHCVLYSLFIHLTVVWLPWPTLLRQQTSLQDCFCFAPWVPLAGWPGCSGVEHEKGCAGWDCVCSVSLSCKY